MRVLICVVVAGCVVDPVDGLGELSDPLVGATRDACAYPEIGRLINGCTAWLVAPDMLVTAAHCVAFETGLSPLGRYVFELNDQCGAATQYDVVRTRSYVDSCNANAASGLRDDLAIAQLALAVPTSLASPMRFVDGWLPNASASVIAGGYGPQSWTDCSRVQEDEPPIEPRMKGISRFTLGVELLDTNVRVAEAPFETTVCRGDSGGPVFTPDGDVFWINAGTVIDIPARLGLSVYAELWRRVAEIEGDLAAWTCPGGGWWDHATVTKEQRYPYARRCGEDHRNYECVPLAGAWQATPGLCGEPDTCRCLHGVAYGGVEIPSERTTCGSTVCGVDQTVYECTAAGWRSRPAERCGPPGPIVEDFSTMPAWTSFENAPWGGAATWRLVSGGQAGKALSASRLNHGSSARVKVYPIAPYRTYTASVYMRVPAANGDYWAETAVKAGWYSAAHFDAHPAEWKMIKKFDDTSRSNGDKWVRYEASFESGASTVVSVGFKLGRLSGASPVVRWDTLRIE